MTEVCTRYEAIVLGASAGGMRPIREIILGLSADLPLAIVVVQHTAERSDDA